MDYSKFPFGTEGCSSSESGWTMYIDPPMEADDIERYNKEDDGNNRKSNYNYGIHGGYNNEDSDDSMASDASSAPSHQHNKHANAAESSHHTTASSKQGKKSGQFKKLFSWKKSNEKKEKGVEHSSKQKHKKDAHNHKKYFK